MRTKNKKLWGGRFSAATDAEVEGFTASVAVDQQLYPYDIQGSMAHVRMLGSVGLLNDEEVEAICTGLQTILEEIETGQFVWRDSLEDVHMNIESRLIEMIGQTGKKLHTARSRNDQVAVDMRLYLKDKLGVLHKFLGQLQEVLLTHAEAQAETIMPGLTHMQSAQPVTFGHHVLAWFEMLQRDCMRIIDCRRRVDVMPLGAAALAGTSFPIDRSLTAELLGFAEIAENSLDAVSDRDFLLEAISVCATIMLHYSRICEELVLWSSERYAYIRLGDGFCTGSSIMPQKKNPDVAELIRGKSAQVIAHANAIYILMKGQALAYNRDMQEDKRPLFDSMNTTISSTRLLAQMLAEMEIDKERMYACASEGYSTATDLAEYLVRKGIPFRDAHRITGTLVSLASEQSLGLAELSLPMLQQQCPEIEADIYSILTLKGSVEARDHFGGTAPKQVRAAIQRARQRLEAIKPE